MQADAISDGNSLDASLAKFELMNDECEIVFQIIIIT